MSKHTHEWEPLFESDTIQPWEAAEWRCECADILTFEEIARRLNATERLSADWATMAASFIYSEYSYKGWEEKQADAYRSYKDCLAYAEALDG